MTDMYDEWDEDPDDFLNYRHQRRLSDPSANLNNYSRYGWKTKPTSATNDQTSKAMSQNEGLDSLASEVSEIEAGDLKDGMSMMNFLKIFCCFVYYYLNHRFAFSHYHTTVQTIVIYFILLLLQHVLVVNIAFQLPSDLIAIGLK